MFRVLSAMCLVVSLVGASCGGRAPETEAPAAKPMPVAKVPKNEAAHVRKLLDQVVDAGWLRGVVVGIHRDSGDTFVGAGTVRPGVSGAPDADTVFEIGSATKVLTALLLADAVKRREVSLDDPVRSHLPADYKVPEKDGKLITLAHLASHTSGLPRLPPGFTPTDLTDPYASLTEAAVKKALTTTSLDSRPGETFAYSNYGTGLLGFALGEVAKTSYEAVLVKRVLVPLGMRSTAITLSPALKDRMAQGHDLDGRPMQPWTFAALGAAGAVRSTARDMLGFVRANLRLDKPAFAESMRLTHVPRHPIGKDGNKGHVGLGWHIDPSGVRWHNGATGGYRSFIAFDAKRRVAVVVLSSSSSWLVDELGKVLLAPRPAGGYRLDVPKPVPVASDVLDRYVGDYELAPSVILKVARAGDGLTVQLTGQPAFRIYPAAEDRFFLRAVKASIKFERDGSGAVVRALVTQGGRTTPAARKP